MLTKKEKILLGSKDVVSKGNVDNFINIELIRNFDEIKPDKINNIFDLNEQYNKERQSSLKFCVYGEVKSKYVNTDGLIIKIETNSGDTIYSPKIETSESIISKIHYIKTFPYSNKNNFKEGNLKNLTNNIFNTNKSSYYFIFELEQSVFSGNTRELILTINDSDKKIFNITKVPIVLFNSENNLIPYGTQTTELNQDGTLTSINNDFPFFYDKHWVKSNINPSKTSSVFFPNKVTSVQENVKDGIGLINVSLDYPSPFGRESVEIIFVNSSYNAKSNIDYTFSAQTLNWKIGEQIKQFKVTVLDNFFTESDKFISFKMQNFVNVELLNNVDNLTTLRIVNDDIPTSVNFINSTEKIEKQDAFVKIGLTLDRPITIDGQYIDIEFIKNIETTLSGGLLSLFGVKNPNNPLVGTDFNMDINNDGLNVPIQTVQNFNIINNIQASPPIIKSNSNIFGNINQTSVATINLSAFTASTTTVINSDQSELDVFNNINIPFAKTIFANKEEKNIGSNVVKKRIYFKKGDSGTIFTTIRLFSKTGYDVLKRIKFKLSNPSRNISIGTQNPTYELIVKDNMINNFGTFIIPGNSESGFGIFKSISNDYSKLIKDYILLKDKLDILLTERKMGINSGNFNNVEKDIENIKIEVGKLKKDESEKVKIWKLYNSSEDKNPSLFFLDKLSFMIKIINDGESIVFNNDIINKGEKVYSKEFSNGFDGLKIVLPTNSVLSADGKSYEKLKYKFSLFLLDSPNIVNEDLDINIVYNNIDVTTYNNDKDGLIGGLQDLKNYFLTSVLEKIQVAPIDGGKIKTIKSNGTVFIGEVVDNQNIISKTLSINPIDIIFSNKKITTIKNIQFLEKPIEITTKKDKDFLPYGE